MPATFNDPDPGALAVKLRRLIDLKRQRSGDTYPISEIAREVSRLYVENQILATHEDMDADGASMAEIERAVEEVRRARPLLDRTYLSDLIRGKRDNPTKKVIEYLAHFFGVSPAYFFSGSDRTPETDAAEGEVEMLALFRQLRQQAAGDNAAQAPELMIAAMRGATQLDPRTVTGMLRMQIAAMEAAAGAKDDE
ncbi:helix-turn-helix domain-containing protein [Streptomyces griseoaurantiacus]|uniref:helix-turn-helix domain-containing protein n=1 Tax=Streptomyces griseoaurantiacus TaxID=68213 RepID=UPI00369413AC